ncbi:hypothetical protein EII31_03770 [Leucobacter sp. OH2974_COT-288]|nr:hypothetical protein EII31_03770 [Leucobacter sp. OH2974_COT-288]
MRASKAASDAAAEANSQAKIDSIAQTRPYVYAEILPSLAGKGSFDLRITNVGKTAAKGLHVQFDSWPEELDDIAEKIKNLFETERTLPPGASIRTFWRLTGKFTDGTEEAGMPGEGTIHLFYGSEDPSMPQYEDQYEVLIYRSGLFPVAEDGPNPDRLSGNQRTFYLLGQAIARAVGNLSR